MITFNESFLFSGTFIPSDYINNIHGVCFLVSGKKTSITAIKEESRNKNIMSFCSKNYLQRMYCCYCCYNRDCNAVNIMLVLPYNCVQRENQIMFRGWQDGSSVRPKMYKCIRLMYLLINYSDFLAL